MYNVLEYLEASAQRYPNKIAFADKDKDITYQDLWIRSQKIGSCLATHFAPRTPVGVFMEKSVDTIVLLFGIVHAGCFYVMLDVKQPKSRLEHILHTLQSTTIVSSSAYDKDLEKLSYEGTVLDVADLEVEIQEERLAEIRQQALDIDPLYGIFTSGSTGIPKGVTVAHRSVIDFIDVFTNEFQITANDQIGNQAPWDFDVSVKDIYAAICTGATVHIIPKQYFSMPVKLLDYLDERGITTIIWAVSAVCIISTLKGFEYKVPKKLTTVMFSGEVMPVKQLNIWKQYLPHARYINLYGPTEITCNCTYHVIDRDYEQGESIPIGIPFKNERVFLLNEEDKEVKKIRELGEICVVGTAVSLGYYNNAAQTKSAFCQNPLHPQYMEMMYRTGDLGYYNEEGLLCFSTRKDFQIKHMGHRIELGEIENRLECIDEINRACCVFEQNKIIAFYGGEIEKRAIIRELKKDLPMFMIPNVFVRIDMFPLTKNGKIDRRELIKRWEVDAYVSA